MNWCNKLTGNTCKLIKRIMSTFPTAAQRRYKKLNTKLYFLYNFMETNFSKRIQYYLMFNLFLVLVLFLFFSRP